MSDKTLKTTIQFRRDTTENWVTNKDVVPAAGEPCFDKDTGVLKIGDGVATYENLPRVGGVSAAHYEGVKGDGVALNISEKAVDIPLAGETAGLVVSSSAENKVAVAADGTMEVNSVNINKLVQTDGDTLILDGGSASV